MMIDNKKYRAKTWGSIPLAVIAACAGLSSVAVATASSSSSLSSSSSSSLSSSSSFGSSSMSTVLPSDPLSDATRTLIERLSDTSVPLQDDPITLIHHLECFLDRADEGTQNLFRRRIFDEQSYDQRILVNALRKRSADLVQFLFSWYNKPVENEFFIPHGDGMIHRVDTVRQTRTTLLELAVTYGMPNFLRDVIKRLRALRETGDYFKEEIRTSETLDRAYFFYLKGVNEVLMMTKHTQSSDAEIAKKLPLFNDREEVVVILFLAGAEVSQDCRFDLAKDIETIIKRRKLLKTEPKETKSRW